MRELKRGVGVVAFAALLLSAMATPALADEPPPLDAPRILETVVPEVLSDAKASSVGTVTESGGVDVVIPSDASAGIDVVAPGVDTLNIGLPFADTAELVNDSAIAFFDNGNGSSTVPLVKEDGSVQVITTITDGSAPTSYAYVLGGVDGSTLRLTSDGGAEMVDGGGIVTATVDAPWAVDANRVPVATHYEIHGDALVQFVEHDSAQVAYPVTADPRVSLGWYVYVKYSKAEVQRYWNGTEFLNKAAAAAACAVAASAVGAAVCGSLTADYFSSIGSTFKSAKAHNQCVEVALTYVGGIPAKWKRYSC